MSGIRVKKFSVRSEGNINESERLNNDDLIDDMEEGKLVRKTNSSKFVSAFPKVADLVKNIMKKKNSLKVNLPNQRLSQLKKKAQSQNLTFNTRYYRQLEMKKDENVDVIQHKFNRRKRKDLNTCEASYLPPKNEKPEMLKSKFGKVKVVDVKNEESWLKEKYEVPKKDCVEKVTRKEQISKMENIKLKDRGKKKNRDFIENLFPTSQKEKQKIDRKKDPVDHPKTVQRHVVNNFQIYKPDSEIQNESPKKFNKSSSILCDTSKNNDKLEFKIPKYKEGEKPTAKKAAKKDAAAKKPAEADTAAAQKAAKEAAAQKAAKEAAAQKAAKEAAAAKRAANSAAAKKAADEAAAKKKAEMGERFYGLDGLSNPLNSSNKGYAMLVKMGYQPGESLGKDKKGRLEPIDIRTAMSNTLELRGQRPNFGGGGGGGHQRVPQKKQQQQPCNVYWKTPHSNTRGRGGFVGGWGSRGNGDPYTGCADPNAGFGFTDPNTGFGGGFTDPNAGFGGGITDPNAGFGGAFTDPNAGYGGRFTDPNAGFSGGFTDLKAGFGGRFTDPNTGYIGGLNYLNAGFRVGFNDPNPGFRGGFPDPNACFGGGFTDPNTGKMAWGGALRAPGGPPY